MKRHISLIILLAVLISYADGSKADIMDDFVNSINPDLSRKQAIRYAMERTFEIQSADNLRRKLNLYLDSVKDVTIVTKSMGLKEQQLDEIIHALGYVFAQDIMSDGVYSIEEIRGYAKIIEPEGIVLNEIIEGMKLEIELRKWRHRNRLIRQLMEAGFPPNAAAIAIEKEEKQTVEESE